MKNDYRPAPPPALASDLHKGSAGRVLCVCGCKEMPGAAILTVRAAQRAGAGLVTLTIFTSDVLGLVPSASPETVYLDLTNSKDLYVGLLPRRIQEHMHHARIAGPGLGTAGITRELVRRLVSSDFEGPLVLDADALNVLGTALEAVTEHPGPVVVTPHPGEAARMLERVVPSTDEGRLACALEIAERTGAICVLKGHRTVVTDGSTTWVSETGNPGMATAGSGDVLCGILVAYLATARLLQRSDWTMFDAVASAVHVHGRAGDLAAQERGERGVIASDLIELLPAAQLHFAGSD